MEFEKRVMLSEEQYFKLVSHYLRINHRYPFIHQTNYYFDTDEMSLRKEHTVLRLRRITHKGNELTLKIKGENGDQEITQDLSIKATHDLLKKNKFSSSEVTDALIKRYGNSLNVYHLVAELSTRRLEIKEDDYLVVIDKNEYNGITDYNLEIEASNKKRAEEVIHDFCKRFDITYGDKYKGKSTRVFESLKLI